MNQLVQGLLTRFIADQAMVGRKESQAFECLAAWCVLAGELRSGAGIEDVMAGDDTVGFDTLAVLANSDPPYEPTALVVTAYLDPLVDEVCCRSPIS